MVRKLGCISDQTGDAIASFEKMFSAQMWFLFFYTRKQYFVAHRQNQTVIFLEKQVRQFLIYEKVFLSQH